MTEAVVLRPLGPADLPAYKALRDEVLAADTEAFTSDAASEALKTAKDYRSRLGGVESGQFSIGAFAAQVLVGAVSVERDRRPRVHHIGHLAGMMVRPGLRGDGLGRRMLEACIAHARSAAGLELLTLSVTAGNPAERLYARFGFERYGTLHHALKIGAAYHDKHLMSMDL